MSVTRSAGQVRALPPCLLRAPDPGARLRLFCFHHAGGAASAFNAWADRLSPDIDVVPVQLPGREKRVKEAPEQSMAALLGALDDQLDGWLDQPYALYGHSMGGLIAYEFALAPRRAGLSAPDRLLVGACAPPGSSRLADAATLPDQALTDLLLVGAGGTDPQLLAHPEWKRWMLRLLRADLRLVAELDRPAPSRPPLPCPVEVFAGLSDTLVPRSALAAWARTTTASHRTHWLPGGHFFHREQSARTLFFHRLDATLAAIRPVRY